MRKLIFSILTVSSLFIIMIAAPLPASAVDEACTGVCPSGQKTVAHADGDRTTCYCVAESEGMAATVADGSIGANVDPDPGQGENTGPSNVVPEPQDEPDPSIS